MRKEYKLFGDSSVLAIYIAKPCMKLVIADCIDSRDKSSYKLIKYEYVDSDDDCPNTTEIMTFTNEMVK